MRSLKDGLTVLRDEIEVKEIMRLIERTARWVDPATFKLLPIWYPEYARRALFYKANWSEPRMNKNQLTGLSEHKREGNTHANKALTYALDLRSDDRPSWSCCHIWGVDDPFYQEANAVVQDRRFFSCVANMVLLPTPLKAFTDTMQEVKAMLRICARHLYGWTCEHDAMTNAVKTINAWDCWDAYPATWPRNPGSRSIPGVMQLNEGIHESAKRRLARIKKDLVNGGPYYPRDEVLAALEFWKIRF